MTTVSGVAASGVTPVAGGAFFFFCARQFGEAVFGVAPVLASLSRV